MDVVTLRFPLLKTRHWKISKAKLAKILIITELIGILAMIWYLRVPLYQKYLAVKPRAYSMAAFNPDTRYMLSENDFLMGVTAPGHKVKLIFTAGGYKRTVKASDQGNWVAQLPKSLKHKSYRLTLANFDTSNQLTNVDSFKAYVQSENIFLQSQAYRYYLRPFLPSTVQAAALKTSPAPKVTATPEAKPAIVGLSTPSSWSKEFTSWVAQSQSIGLYPYCEYNGQVDPTCNEASDVLLADYATYANVCQMTVSCYISPRAVTKISSDIDSVLVQSLARGEVVAYAAVAPLLEAALPVAPQYRNLVNQLSDTTVDPLNSEEQALLDKRDGKTPAITPYVEIVNSTPVIN